MLDRIIGGRFSRPDCFVVPSDFIAMLGPKAFRCGIEILPISLPGTLGGPASVTDGGKRESGDGCLCRLAGPGEWRHCVTI